LPVFAIMNEKKQLNQLVKLNFNVEIKPSGDDTAVNRIDLWQKKKVRNSVEMNYLQQLKIK